MSAARFAVAALLICAVLSSVNATSPIIAQPETCDAAGLTQCATALQSCLEAAGDNQARCSCRGQYDDCLISIGCPNYVVCAAYQACQETGCQNQNCFVNQQNQNECQN